MKNVVIGIDMEYEALLMLGAIASKGTEDVYNKGTREAVQRLIKTNDLPAEEYKELYEPILELSDYLIENMADDKDDIIRYFRDVKDLDLSLAIAVVCMRRANQLETTDVRERLAQRIKILSKLLSENLGNDELATTTKGFVKLLQESNQNICEKSKKHLIDFIFCYEEYEEKIIAIIERAKELLLKRKEDIDKIIQRELPFFESELKNVGGIANLMKKYGIVIEVTEDVELNVSLGAFNYVSAQKDFLTDKLASMHIGVMVPRLYDTIMGDKNDAVVFVKRVKLLGDNTRLNILSALKNKEMCGQELVELTKLTPATISHHMNELTSYRIVNVIEGGKKFIYKVNEEQICEVARQMIEKTTSYTVSFTKKIEE